VAKNTEFFSTYDPYTLLSVLKEYAAATGITLTVAKDKYKAKLTLVNQVSETEVDTVEINARILKVAGVDGGEDKFCFEFGKCGETDQLKFFDAYNNIKEYFGDYINATN